MSEATSPRPRHQYEAFLHQLPVEWEQKEITQVGAIVGGGTPSREVPSFWRGPIPWVTPGEVSGEKAQLLHDTNDHISASGLAGSGASLLPAGSLLVTTRATLGARVINAVPMATNQGFKSIVFKKPEEAGYYYHLFEKVKPELVRRASGTTFLEISGAEFGSIKVPSPSQDERLKIAQLLDTLDTAIHQTEAIVEKLKQVKQGLLHDLSMRGVNANGELRATHEQAPHLYKESPLGWIPKEWETKTIAQLGTVVGGGTPSREVPSFWRGEIPWLTPGEVSKETAKYLSDTSDHISPSGLVGSGANLLPKGSLMVTTRATLGARVINAVPMATNQGFKSIIFRRPEDASYYYHVFERVEPELVRRASGTTFLEISGTEFSGIQVPSPPPSEKDSIAQMLDTADRHIANETGQFVKLTAQKLGLMDDILTGRVRVTPLLAK